jgi:hypothetical protein
MEWLDFHSIIKKLKNIHRRGWKSDGKKTAKDEKEVEKH